MNRAFAIGTLDRANIEIRDRVGVNNFFLGLTAAKSQKKTQGYNPQDYYHPNPQLGEAIAQSASLLLFPR